MKTRTTPSMLIALLLAFLAFGATKAQAIVVVDGRPVGINFGQTAWVNLLNTSDRAIIVVGGNFLDSDGNVLAEFAGGFAVDPGVMIAFDLNADDIIRESNRIEIRAVITAETSRGLLISAEVFENDTGKTTVF